jgi:membrane protease YdiL (CAAX protease family)
MDGTSPRKNFAALKNNGVALVIIFYLCVLVLAAILMPILFGGIKIIEDISPDEPFQYFIGKGLGEFFDRARFIALALLLFPFLKICGLKSLGDIQCHRIPFRRFLFTFAKGFILGFFLALSPRGGGEHVVFTSALHSYVPILCGTWFSWCNLCMLQPAAFFLCICALARVSVLVGFVDEIIFRGVIFNLFRRNLHIFWAILLASLFFAYCHVSTRSGIPIDADGVTLWSGFRCAMATLLDVGYGLHPVIFLNFIAFGILSSILLLKHGSLMVPIAFHMGVVFAGSGARILSWIPEDADASLGTDYLNINVLDSWINLVIQGLMILWVTWRMSRKHSKAE